MPIDPAALFKMDSELALLELTSELPGPAPLVLMADDWANAADAVMASVAIAIKNTRFITWTPLTSLN